MLFMTNAVNLQQLHVKMYHLIKVGPVQHSSFAQLDVSEAKSNINYLIRFPGKCGLQLQVKGFLAPIETPLRSATDS